MSAVAAVVVALVVGGLATPRHHAVARTMTVPAPPEAVWAIIRDVARYGEWRHDLESADVVDADQPAPQPRWREVTTGGSITFGMTVDEPPARMVARILDEDLQFTGEWSWRLVPDINGTRVTITERGSVGNPVVRFVGAHFVGHTKSIDRYLRALGERHGAYRLTIDDAAPA